MSFFWQHIPEYLDPIAFTVGFFSVRFYALFWLLGFFGAFGLFLWRMRQERYPGNVALWYDLFLALFLGAFLGGHLGYFLLYQPSVLWRFPEQVFWPVDLSTGAWIGLSGMSFHGGLMGALIILLVFVRKKKLLFWDIADRLVVALPIALFFGRIGNFLNQELYGRVTERPWGMFFVEAAPLGVLRHPSALYEAFGEGILLFLFLLFFTKRLFRGGSSALFLIGYGSIRFFLEFFREPDMGASVWWGIWTSGQLYSGAMIAVGVVLFLWLRQKNHDILRG